MLENSLNAKEKLISELNMELHNIETTLSNERVEHINEVKKLAAMLNEKVIFQLAKYSRRFCSLMLITSNLYVITLFGSIFSLSLFLI